MPLLATLNFLIIDIQLSTSIIKYIFLCNLFLMGIILYIAYDRRRNLKDSMMVHIFNNSLTTLPF